MPNPCDEEQTTIISCVYEELDYWGVGDYHSEAEANFNDAVKRHDIYIPEYGISDKKPYKERKKFMTNHGAVVTLDEAWDIALALGTIEPKEDVIARIMLTRGYTREYVLQNEINSERFKATLARFSKRDLARGYATSNNLATKRYLMRQFPPREPVERWHS